MPRLNADTCLYATAADAVAAVPERHSYAAATGVGENGRTPPDVLGVLPGALVVELLEMPSGLRSHSAENACSSTLSPAAPHAHPERHQLTCPGCAPRAATQSR